MCYNAKSKQHINFFCSYSMRRLKLSFLMFALLSTSAWSVSDILGGKYRFRCYLACVDQTSTQNDYVEQRDHCRELAQLKVEMALKEAGIPANDKSRKSMLVNLFSQCMASNGWTVPDGKDPNSKALAAAPGAAPATAAIVPVSAASVAVANTPAAKAALQQEQQQQLVRAAECGFARSNARVSSISAARAKACDLECEEGLRVAPSAPRPASCPGEAPPKYASGNVD